MTLPKPRCPLLLVAVLLTWSRPLVAESPPDRGALATQYVFLVTADGLRPQELFRGIDPLLSEEANRQHAGIEDWHAFRRQYWADTPVERRRRLLPFFWNELARHGVILGNRDKRSRVHVKNPHRISYPGYAEILNGQPQKAITGNQRVFSPRPTLLEYIRERFHLSPYQVAAFASWDVFDWITMHRQDSIYCNAGYEEVPVQMLGPGAQLLNRLQFDMLTPWDTVRHDAVTLGLSLAYIEKYEPKFFFLALGETDDWGHDRRYDRVVRAIRLFDDALRRLWTLLQSMDRYKGRSTLVVTTDHGRGRRLNDWTSHGPEVPGSEETWIGVFGPDTPKGGELSDTREVTQSHIAATILRFYGLDARNFNPRAETDIEEAFRR